MWMQILASGKALNEKLTQPEEVEQVLKGMTESTPSKNSPNSEVKSLNNQTGQSGAYISPYRATHMKDTHF